MLTVIIVFLVIMNIVFVVNVAEQCIMFLCDKFPTSKDKRRNELMRSIEDRKQNMKNFFIILILLVNVGCANKLLKKAPVLAAAETFYVFEKDVKKISHNKCKKRNGNNRKCKRTYFDIEEMWNLFYPGFIIIKKEKVFR